jgi:hypothetical protein
MAGQPPGDAALAWLKAAGARDCDDRSGRPARASAIKVPAVVTGLSGFGRRSFWAVTAFLPLQRLGLESLDAPPTFRRVAFRECGRDIWESWERV